MDKTNLTMSKYTIIKDTTDFRENQNSIQYTFNHKGNTLSINLNLITAGLDHRLEKQFFSHPKPTFSRLFCFKSGMATLQCNHKTHRLKTGLIYLLPDNTAFEVDYEPSSLCYFHFECKDFSSLSLFSDLLDIQFIDDPQLFSQLTKAQKENQHAMSSILLTTLLKFCQPQFDRLSHKKKVSERFKPIFEIIQNSKVALLRIEQLARELKTSKEALSKDFSRRMGLSLKSYLNQIDQERAMHLLLHTSLTIQEVTHRLGYSNTSYFYKVFKKRTGFSPREYRLKENYHFRS